MLNTKKVTDPINQEVYVESGELFGTIEEAVLAENKVFGWRVRASKASVLDKVLGGAKGVIIPHQYVKSMGDIVIISRAALPTIEEKGES